MNQGNELRICKCIRPALADMFQACKSFTQVLFWSTKYVLPFIAIGKLHIKTVTTEECFTVQRDLNVGWMRNRFTDQHQTGHGRLFVAAVSLIAARVVHTDVASAVEYLWQSCILNRDWVLVCHTTHCQWHTQTKVLPLPTLCCDGNRKAALLPGRWLKESSSSHAAYAAISRQAASSSLLGAGWSNMLAASLWSTSKVTLVMTLISNCLSKRYLTI